MVGAAENESIPYSMCSATRVNSARVAYAAGTPSTNATLWSPAIGAPSATSATSVSAPLTRTRAFPAKRTHVTATGPVGSQLTESEEESAENATRSVPACLRATTEGPTPYAPSSCATNPKIRDSTAPSPPPVPNGTTRLTRAPVSRCATRGTNGAVWRTTTTAAGLAARVHDSTTSSSTAPSVAVAVHATTSAVPETAKAWTVRGTRNAHSTSAGSTETGVCCALVNANRRILVVPPRLPAATAVATAPRTANTALVALATKDQTPSRVRVSVPPVHSASDHAAPSTTSWSPLYAGNRTVGAAASSWISAATVVAAPSTVSTSAAPPCVAATAIVPRDTAWCPRAATYATAVTATAAPSNVHDTTGRCARVRTATHAPEFAPYASPTSSSSPSRSLDTTIAALRGSANVVAHFTTAEPPSVDSSSSPSRSSSTTAGYVAAMSTAVAVTTRLPSVASIAHVRPEGIRGATTSLMPATRTRHGPAPFVGSTVAARVTERRAALETRAVHTTGAEPIEARTAYDSPARGAPLGATRTMRFPPTAPATVPDHAHSSPALLLLPLLPLLLLLVPSSTTRTGVSVSPFRTTNAEASAASVYATRRSPTSVAPSVPPVHTKPCVAPAHMPPSAADDDESTSVPFAATVAVSGTSRASCPSVGTSIVAPSTLTVA